MSDKVLMIGMKNINVEWHKKNKMKKNPTIEQKIKWHLEHQKNCKCRPIPEKLLEEMKKRNMKPIEEIIGKMKCEKNFNCYKSGFEVLCKGKDIGLMKYLECLEKNPHKCKFSLSYNDIYLCKCPLRVYIAKELKK